MERFPEGGEALVVGIPYAVDVRRCLQPDRFIHDVVDPRQKPPDFPTRAHYVRRIEDHSMAKHGKVYDVAFVSCLAQMDYGPSRRTLKELEKWCYEIVVILHHPKVVSSRGELTRQFLRAETFTRRYPRFRRLGSRGDLFLLKEPWDMPPDEVGPDDYDNTET